MPNSDFIDAPPATADIHTLAFDFEPMWKGEPLEAFTEDRQALAEQLWSHSPGVANENAATEAYMPRVWAVLWLCTHKPAQWRHLRAQPALWWETIEAWALEHCPRALWPEAITLVYGRKEDGDGPKVMGLWEAARANIVQIKRKPGPDGSLGNALRQ